MTNAGKIEEATPRPWRTDPETEHEGVLGPDGVLVADCSIFVNPDFGDRSQQSNRANAHLIVRAINAHEGIVKALDNSIESLRNIRDALAREFPNIVSLPDFKQFDIVIANCETALKQSEGTQ